MGTVASEGEGGRLGHNINGGVPSTYIVARPLQIRRLFAVVDRVCGLWIS
jgi:hypothetical protein